MAAERIRGAIGLEDKTSHGTVDSGPLKAGLCSPYLLGKKWIRSLRTQTGELAPQISWNEFKDGTNRPAGENEGAQIDTPKLCNRRGWGWGWRVSEAGTGSASLKCGSGSYVTIHGS